MKNHNKLNILLIGQPYCAVNIKSFLDNILEALKPNSTSIFVISAYIIQGKKILSYRIKNKKKRNSIPGKIVINLYNQFVFCKYLLKNKFDLVIYLPQFYIFPILLLKIMKKPIILYMGGRASKSIGESENKIIRTFILAFEKIIFQLVDYIVVESYSVIKWLELEKYRNKIFICPQWVDLKKFQMIKSPNKRKYHAAYIGGLSNEKGGLAFINTIELFSSSDNFVDYKFLIVGNGIYQNRMLELVNKGMLNDDNFLYLDWVDHELIPSILQNVKILIVPSASEGLPNIVLEAMASGAIVLATKVGAIPDIIIHGRNGFILNDQMPSTIRDNIIYINSIEENEINNILISAREKIEEIYSKEACIERWHNILFTISK